MAWSKKYLLKFACLAAFAVAALAGRAAAEEASRPQKPNVVMLLADDVGWQDLVCYDIDKPHPYETPNLDALAKRGVMFWQAYSPAPTCVPSRVAIMTGEHPARSGVTHVNGNRPPAPHHIRRWSMMSPWYSRMISPTAVTFPQLLQKNGYYTGHAGKWHIQNHLPEEDLRIAGRQKIGFHYTKSERGARHAMRNRFKDFATNKEGTLYQLDENGYPYHQNNVDALNFLQLSQKQDKPFFLYYATWLVHGPWHTRSEALLKKYCKKLAMDYPINLKDLRHKNPIYCAMVQEVDYYLGQIIDYLKNTDDPRWPGHKLIENTYIIFTSDNGGVIGGRKEMLTSNKPLQKGKISAMEGGVRVPLIITGPDVPAGVESDVMVNGLDFFPTIMDWTGTKIPANLPLDGLNIAPFLRHDPTNPNLVVDQNNQPRDTMVWHFPNSYALESTIRIGGYKLIRNYNIHAIGSRTPPLELYQLYKEENGKQVRVDIEEACSLVAEMPQKTKEMNQRLTEILTEMGAAYPHQNPGCPRLDAKERQSVPSVTSHKIDGDMLRVTYKENGHKVVAADLIYWREGSGMNWEKAALEILPGNKLAAKIPAGTTYCIINLIDEKNFLVSYPRQRGDDLPALKKGEKRGIKVAQK